MAVRRQPDEARGPSPLEQALPGLRPLRDRDKVVAPASAPTRPSRAARAGPQPARFEVLQSGERVEGIAPGVDRRVLRRLRRGEIRSERELDLHGMTLAQARLAVHAALAEALADEQRCLRVIHGRGSHSKQGPRLKTALVGWFAEPPHGPHVLAFASSLDGGATSVLLRRSR